MNSERIELVKKIGENFSRGYSAARIQGILNATSFYSDSDFKTLCFEIENCSRTLPLRDEWLEVAHKLGIKSDKERSDGNCVYCNNKHYVDAIEIKTAKRKDAFGNPWPMVKSFICWCNSGNQTNSGVRFTKAIADEWYPVRYNQHPDDALVCIN